MEAIRIGVIGAGSIAQTAHLPVLQRMRDVHLVCICDNEKGKLTAVADRFAIQETTRDYRELLERTDIDAIVVSTPTDTHHPIGLASIRAGKHTLIERPLARTRAEAVELSAAAAERDVVLMVAMNHRFRHDITALKTLLQHNELGAISVVNAGWLNYQSSEQSWIRKRDRSGGGVFIDLGIVMIDLVLYLLGFPKVVSVSSSMFSHKTRAVEDTAGCFIRLDNGAALHLNVSWNAPLEKQQYYIDMIGTKGSASVNPLRIHTTIGGAPVNITPVLPESGPSLFRKSYEHQIRHFIGAIRHLHPVISTSEEAVHRMLIVDAAYTSAETGREVILA